MDKAKLRLSPKEAELVANADWILTKNQIILKVKYLLANLLERQQTFLKSNGQLLPAEVSGIAGKISRGENYKGLPWLVLDYPRYFGKEDHFAIRSMFWWGNYFSITLQLSGSFKKHYQQTIAGLFKELKNDSFFLGVNEDLWEHHFEKDNYVSLEESGEHFFRKTISDKTFIKLAKQITLDHWDDAEEMLYTSFVKMIRGLAG